MPLVESGERGFWLAVLVLIADVRTSRWQDPSPAFQYRVFLSVVVVVVVIVDIIFC